MSDVAAQTVVLPPVIDLDALDEIRDALIDRLDAGPVALAAQDVERVSTNGLFVLLSAAETARRAGFDCIVSAPSAALRQAVARLGLERSFAPLFKD